MGCGEEMMAIRDHSYVFGLTGQWRHLLRWGRPTRGGTGLDREIMSWLLTSGVWESCYSSPWRCQVYSWLWVCSSGEKPAFRNSEYDKQGQYCTVSQLNILPNGWLCFLPTPSYANDLSLPSSLRFIPFLLLALFQKTQIRDFYCWLWASEWKCRKWRKILPKRCCLPCTFGTGSPIGIALHWIVHSCAMMVQNFWFSPSPLNMAILLLACPLCFVCGPKSPPSEPK